ncbi:hypothetical protein P7C70_g4151, partial [Phenoliferia sp. Uapishka_3]
MGLRALPAIFGAFTPPLVYATMREGGSSVAAALFSTSLVLLDNAHVVQSRLILLDGPLVFFIVASTFCYMRFSNLAKSDFTRSWWMWLCLTGAGLSATIGSKMVGLFTFFTIGTSVAVDLLSILAPRPVPAGLPRFRLRSFGKHLAARSAGLILLPATIYLAFFWVHLAILTQTGTGDDFMGVEFQRTLAGSPYLLPSEEIRHFDIITLRHRDTRGFLQASAERDAPSSIIAVLNASACDQWIIEPTREVPATGRGRIVRQHEVITLRQRATNLTLSAIQRASSVSRFTTSSDQEAATRPSSTHFKLVIDEAHEGQQWLSNINPFSLVHAETQTAIITRTSGSVQQSKMPVTGSRDLMEDAALWVVSDIFPQPDGAGRTPARRKGKALQRLPFWRKFFELQRLMLEHNAEITDEHPYTSRPSTWPFLLKGISFWVGPAADRSQVYMIGNPIGWGVCVLGLALSPFAMAWKVRKRRRSRGNLAPRTSTTTEGFHFDLLFMAGWAFHYFPFFLMSRQLFLHHYLPAHLFSALVAGRLFDLITIRARLPRRKKILLLVLCISFELAGFLYFAPLTYGTSLASTEAVRRRRLFSTWLIVSPESLRNLFKSFSQVLNSVPGSIMFPLEKCPLAPRTMPREDCSSCKLHHEICIYKDAKPSRNDEEDEIENLRDEIKRLRLLVAMLSEEANRPSNHSPQPQHSFTLPPSTSATFSSASSSASTSASLPSSFASPVPPSFAYFPPLPQPPSYPNASTPNPWMYPPPYSFPGFQGSPNPDLSTTNSQLQPLPQPRPRSQPFSLGQPQPQSRPQSQAKDDTKRSSSPYSMSSPASNSGSSNAGGSGSGAGEWNVNAAMFWKGMADLV